MKRHVVLIGLPGSGKTTVGRMVADVLKATFSDVDALIERDEGRTVTQIFADRGEPAFRALERARVESLLGDSPGVIAPGGGWAAAPGTLESLRGRAIAVYLVTSPEIAAERVAPQGGRPLLAGADPAGAMRGLLRARRARYERADAAVTTDGRAPEIVAGEVVVLARSLGGW